MRGIEARDSIRKAARAFEEALPPEQRKRLGQFFTGVPLGKLLAHLALEPETRTVLDPMAGHGDLLDATAEAAGERGIMLERLDGIEIDDATASMCRQRLDSIMGENGSPLRNIFAGNAFDLEALKNLPVSTYDLVITNPPYVRYQARNGAGGHGDTIRAGLRKIVDSRCSGTEGDIWQTLAAAYSGLADFSVPAWLLAALMVRPGGRLALVVPATWRTRDYADVIRYLLLRCFSLEYIVEDTQPGWFTDALVRTHLIVAKRLEAEDACQPLHVRDHWPRVLWLQVAPDAANDSSLTGAAFDGPQPEAELAARLQTKQEMAAPGIEVRYFDSGKEWAALRPRITRHRWYHKLEGGGEDLPLFAAGRAAPLVMLPGPLRDLLPSRMESQSLVLLEYAGIRVGQGLRTGCNRFFYVTACGPSKDGMVLVEASPAFSGLRFSVPSHALRPVLRRQSEMAYLLRGELPPGRVLDLCGLALPEDAGSAAHSMDACVRRGAMPPRIMPEQLAAFVRRAASYSPEGSSKPIPELSAVRTNVRPAGNGETTPRHWYMLPDFAVRHMPAAFVARINNGVPWVECNADPPMLIDANFSTFWAQDNGWTRFALKALLNSIWCRAFMEALGTPLGGGALKLEATHLRQMLVPRLTDTAKAALHATGKDLRRDTAAVQTQIDSIVLLAILPEKTARSVVPELVRDIAAQAHTLRSARQRAAS
ncbi:MAG: N-6 DNA methylase [Dongiaceae bacterium]